MRRTRRLVAASSCALVVAAAAAAYAFRSPNSDLRSALVQAAALLAATAGWMFNNAVSLSLKSRELAFEYIELATTNDRMTPLLRPIARRFGDPLFAAIVDNPETAADWYFANLGTDDLLDDMQVAANLFEGIAIGIRHGAVDEAIMKDYYRGLLTRFWGRYSVFLPAMRNAREWHLYRADKPVRSDVAEHAEWLARRWKPTRRERVRARRSERRRRRHVVNGTVSPSTPVASDDRRTTVSLE